MNKEKLNIVKSVFKKALEIDSSERENFLEEECNDNDEIKREVKSLIDAYTYSEDFLEIPTIQSSGNFVSESAPDQFIGKHIGSYLIEKQAGIGGMGVVYQGKRDDKEFEHKVAIKILKHNFNSEYVLKRFQNERQTLANLQHPNIARLLDGGKTDDGLPYLVMEYIDGVAITEYCDEKKLTTRSRLELFRTVCSAVQYAHQNLIVHRDIKPGNVIVNKEGRPKLLDFGIAKLMHKEINEANDELTKTGMWNLTPEYASPEQINDNNITTRSDIYSLGILLYQLLTGHQPYKISGVTPSAISKIITEEKIDKPSDKLGSVEEVFSSDGPAKQITPDSVSNTRNEKPEKIYKYLKGDLDNIILKAIQKDPERRYSSVDQFSEDIQRYLTGLPVIARKDTVGYRFSKFVQRHKISVALTALLTLILISSAILIAWQANIAANQRDKAQTEAKKFEKVNTFLQGMLSSVDPTEIGRDVRVYDILEKAAEDIETNLKDQPEIEVSIRSTLGNTYVNLGEYDKGKPFLEKALEINENLYGKESEQTAFSLHDLGLYYDWIGDYKMADSTYEKSIRILRKVLKQPTSRFADVLNDYAIVIMNYGQYEKAEKLYREAIDIALSTYGEKNRNTAVMINNLALNQLDAGNFDEAEKYFKKSLALIVELLGENRPEVGSNYNNLSYLYMLKKDYNLAEEYLLKSYELKLKLKGEDHPDVGLALNNLGAINFKMKIYNKAEKYLLDAIEQYRKTLPEDHVWIGLSNFWLGKVFLQTDRLDESESRFRKSLDIRLKKFPENHVDIWQSRIELGHCLFAKKKYTKAESLFLSSLEFYKKNYPEETEQLTTLYDYTIKLYETMGDKGKASYYLNQRDSLTQ